MNILHKCVMFVLETRQQIFPSSRKMYYFCIFIILNKSKIIINPITKSRNDSFVSFLQHMYRVHRLPPIFLPF